MNTVMNKIENNEYNLDEKETCAIFRTIDNFINKLKIIQCLNDSKEEKIIDCNNWSVNLTSISVIPYFFYYYIIFFNQPCLILNLYVLGISP